MVFNLYQAGYNVKLSIMAPLSPTAVLAIWHSTSIQIIIHATKKSSFCEDFFVQHDGHAVMLNKAYSQILKTGVYYVGLIVINLFVQFDCP